MRKSHVSDFSLTSPSASTSIFSSSFSLVLETNRSSSVPNSDLLFLAGESASSSGSSSSVGHWSRRCGRSCGDTLRRVQAARASVDPHLIRDARRPARAPAHAQARRAHAHVRRAHRARGDGADRAAAPDGRRAARVQGLFAGVVRARGVRARQDGGHGGGLAREGRGDGAPGEVPHLAEDATVSGMRSIGCWTLSICTCCAAAKS
jgi:hypothetical protein